MEVTQELLPGAWLLRLRRLDDTRGSFVKTFARSSFQAAGLAFDMAEEFYSVSDKDVVRGLHCQVPPHQHAKVVYCAMGSVLDVLLDLRAGPAYGRVASITLDARQPALLLLPPGIAHGFRSLESGSLMVYKTSSEHAPSHDAGVRWDSIGFDWGIQQPVVSERDAQHPRLADFRSPFGPPTPTP